MRRFLILLVLIALVAAGGSSKIGFRSLGSCSGSDFPFTSTFGCES